MTGDTKVDHVIIDGDNYVVWAMSNVDDLSVRHTKKGGATINFHSGGGQQDSNINLALIHGICMFVAW